MKRFAFVICFVALLLSPLFSADLIGHGSGSTEEEAILRARQDLLISIRVKVSVSTTVSVLDNGNTTENIFSSSSTSSSSGIFKGLETTTSNNGGTWEATCSILESKYKLYEEALKNTITSINNCQKEIDKGLNAKEEIEYLQIQIEQYELFDFYSDILLMLGHVSSEKPLVGKELVQSRFNIVFAQIDAPALADTDSEKNTAEYKKALAQYEERQKINSDIKKEKELELQEYQEKLSKEQKETLSLYEKKANEAYKTLASTSYSLSLDSRVSSFIEARATLRNFYENNTNSLETLNESSENLISETRNSIFARPYDAIAEMKNGKPTEKAQAERTRTADNETRKVIETQNKLYSEAFEVFKESAEKLYPAYDKATSYVVGAFSISSALEDTSFIVGKYDASSYSWPFAFSFTILGHSITVNGNISDDEVLKLGKEAESNWRKDTEYHSLVELYDAFFHSENTLVVTCNLNASMVVSTGKIDINGVSYNVTRLDNSSFVSTGTQEVSFSYEYEKADSLELVFYALGSNKDEAEKNVKELFLGEALASQALYEISSEDKNNFSIAKIVIKESSIPKIEALQDSLKSEYYEIDAEVSGGTKSYNDLLKKLEEGERVSDILVAFGKAPTEPFKNAESYKTTFSINILREKYLDIINSGVKESDLDAPALEFINSITSKTNTIENSEKEDFKAFCTNYEQLVAEREELQSKLESDEITYSEEEIKADYQALKTLEEEILSESKEITLSSDVFVPTIITNGILIEDLRIKYEIDAEEIPELADFEFEISISQIIGEAPSNLEEKETYYQKLLGAIYLLTESKKPFTVTLKLSVNTDSEGRDGSLSEYIPFSWCQIECTYSVQSSYNDTVFQTGSLTFFQKAENSLSSFSSEAEKRVRYEEQLEIEKEAQKKQRTKTAIVNFFREATYGIAGVMSEQSNYTAFRLSATKYNDYTFYGFGVGFLYEYPSFKTKETPQDVSVLGGLGVSGKIGIKTSEKINKTFKFLNLFLSAGAFGSIDFIPTLYGVIPNLTIGVSLGASFWWLIMDVHIEVGYGITLGKNSGTGAFASFIFTFPMHLIDD